MQSQPRVVIVGGGISGLATAHYLKRELGDRVRVTLVEGSARLGGKISTQQVAGHLVDTGPDALMARAPGLTALLADLGLASEVVAPAAQGSYLWSRGRLRRLPPGTLFGVPDRLGSLLRARLLSPAGLARAALDLVLPRRPARSSDPSVADVVVPRLGSQVYERLVEPLLGGVYAGPADRLSARSTVPDIADIARENRSLYLGLRRLRRRPAPAAGGPSMVTFTTGLARLVRALAAGLSADDLRLGVPADVLARDGTGYQVGLADGHSIAAEAVVLATPAFVTAELLRPVAPGAAEVLSEVPYADVATLTLAYPRSAIPGRLDATGFLVPPREGRLLVGCSWSSVKWPHLADEGLVLVRCMVGRYGDRRWVSMDDDTLLHLVHDELVEAMGLMAAPVSHHVQRWPQALPQYLVGHQRRLDAVEAALRDLPGVHLTGAAYRGVGLASCVADAERTARLVVQGLVGVRPPAPAAS